MKNGLLRIYDQSIPGYIRDGNNFIRNNEVITVRDSVVSAHPLAFINSAYNVYELYPMDIANVEISGNRFFLIIDGNGYIYALPEGRDTYYNSGSVEYTPVYAVLAYNEYFEEPLRVGIYDHYAKIIETSRYIYILGSKKQYVILKNGIIKYYNAAGRNSIPVNGKIYFSVKDATITDMEDEEYSIRYLDDYAGKLLNGTSIRLRYRSELGGRGKPTRPKIISTNTSVIALPGRPEQFGVFANGELKAHYFGYLIADTSSGVDKYATLNGVYSHKFKTGEVITLWQIDSHGNARGFTRKITNVDPTGVFTIDQHIPGAVSFPLITPANCVIQFGNKHSYLWTTENVNTNTVWLATYGKYVFAFKIVDKTAKSNIYTWDISNKRIQHENTSGYRYTVEMNFLESNAFSSIYSAIASDYQAHFGKFIHVQVYFDSTPPEFYLATEGFVPYDTPEYTVPLDFVFEGTPEYWESVEDFNVWNKFSQPGRTFYLKNDRIHTTPYSDAVIVLTDLDITEDITETTKIPELYADDMFVADAPLIYENGTLPHTTPNNKKVKFPVIATKPTMRYAIGTEPFSTRYVGEFTDVIYHNHKFYFLHHNVVKITNELLEYNPINTLTLDGVIKDVCHFADGILVLTTSGLFLITEVKGGFNISLVSSIKGVVRLIETNNSNFVFLQTENNKILSLVRRYEGGYPVNAIEETDTNLYAEDFTIYDAIFYDGRLWLATTDGIYVRNNDSKVKDFWRLTINSEHNVIKFIESTSGLYMLTGDPRAEFDYSKFVSGGGIG